MKSYLKKLMNREDLTIEETEEAVSLCFESTITDTEMAAFLTALKVKGETSDEMTGIVNTVRSYSEYQSVNYPGIMDNCEIGRASCRERGMIVLRARRGKPKNEQ